MEKGSKGRVMRGQERVMGGEYDQDTLYMYETITLLFCTNTH
jgi:hypothetical protein